MLPGKHTLVLLVEFVVLGKTKLYSFEFSLAVKNKPHDFKVCLLPGKTNSGANCRVCLYGPKLNFQVVSLVLSWRNKLHDFEVCLFLEL